MPSSGYLKLIGLCLDERARSRTSGPTRPISMTLNTPTPAIAMLTFGLLYPGLDTIRNSLYRRTSDEFIGLDNYVTAFTEPQFGDVRHGVSVLGRPTRAIPGQGIVRPGGGAASIR